MRGVKKIHFTPFVMEELINYQNNKNNNNNKKITITIVMMIMQILIIPIINSIRNKGKRSSKKRPEIKQAKILKQIIMTQPPTTLPRFDFSWRKVIKMKGTAQHWTLTLKIKNVTFIMGNLVPGASFRCKRKAKKKPWNISDTWSKFAKIEEMFFRIN